VAYEVSCEGTELTLDACTLFQAVQGTINHANDVGVSCTFLAPSATCSECPAGKFSDNTGNAACMECAAGTSSAAGSTSASDCVQCETGKFAGFAGSSNCTSCVAGKYAAVDLGATVCADCATGKSTLEVGSASSSDCIKCEDGTASPGGSPCETCAAGKVSRTSELTPSHKLTKCPRLRSQFTYMAANAPVGSASCTDCAPGTGSVVVGSSHPNDCRDCEAGSSGEGGTPCVVCAAGMYSGGGAASCISCSAGKSSAAAGSVSSENCVECSPGKASVTGSAHCSECAGGQPAEDQSGCLCGPGYEPVLVTPASSSTMPGKGSEIWLSDHTFNSEGQVRASEASVASLMGSGSPVD
jgi:syndecan 4